MLETGWLARRASVSKAARRRRRKFWSHTHVLHTRSLPSAAHSPRDIMTAKHAKMLRPSGYGYVSAMAIDAGPAASHQQSATLVMVPRPCSPCRLAVDGLVGHADESRRRDIPKEILSVSIPNCMLNLYLKPWSLFAAAAQIPTRTLSF